MIAFTGWVLQVFDVFNALTHSRRRREGRGGGRPPIRFKTSKIIKNSGKWSYLFGQIVWILGHTIAKIPSQFRCRPFFFFFFF